jgi:hypothetical protein
MTTGEIHLFSLGPGACWEGGKRLRDRMRQKPRNRTTIFTLDNCPARLPVLP